MRFLKAIIFYPLLWLRGIFMLIGKIIGGLILLSFIICVAGKLLGMLPDEASWWDVGFIGLVSFVIFLLLEFYDQILLKHNPTDTALILER